MLSPDSLLYIFTAQTFLDQGMQAALEAYHWPLLSLLIAAIHQLTGFSLVLSGHLLIAGCQLKRCRVQIAADSLLSALLA